MALAKELRKLCQEPLDGIKVTLNEEDITDVTAEITGPGTPPFPASLCASKGKQRGSSSSTSRSSSEQTASSQRVAVCAE